MSSMSKRAIYNLIKEGIESGIYKSVRLSKYNDNGEKETLMPFSKTSKVQDALSRLEHIKLQLDRKLPPGEYIIEAKTGHLNSSLTDSFAVTIKTPVTIAVSENKNNDEKIIDAINDQETMRDFDFDEYKDLIQENANLKAKIYGLELKIQILEDNLKNKPLNDAPIGNSFVKAIEEHIPSVVHIIDKFMEMTDNKIKLRNRELDLSENGGTFKRKKIINNQDKILAKMEDLYENDPDSFELTLDELEKKDPKLYSFICEKMNLEEEEEESNEN